MRLRFTKMHGIGNDFVMVDAITQKVTMTPERARKLANRHYGVGCDQVLVVEPPHSPDTDFSYRIFNHDGNEVENCGNGARCFALFVRQRGLTAKKKIQVETCSGKMTLLVHDNNQVQVNMGVPELRPHKIPFDWPRQQPTYPLMLSDIELEVSAISMGNPHAVCCVEDLHHYPVASLGPQIESHAKFPQKVNAGFMEIISPSQINLRVYERGAGETLACGTGACAAVVCGRLREQLNERVKVGLLGGELIVEWGGRGKPVMMTGPAETVFHGQVKV